MHVYHLMSRRHRLKLIVKNNERDFINKMLFIDIHLTYM